MKPIKKPSPVPSARSGVSVTRALICVGAFYSVMVLLNGVSVQESAALLEFGWQRSAACALNRPLELISHGTCAYRVRQSLRDTVGRWLNQSE